MTFVHCEKNAEWILQGAVGAAEKATLKRSKLFDTLKAKLKAAVRRRLRLPQSRLRMTRRMLRSLTTTP